MKKNFKVITINGIRGILAVIFIALGLIAGFIISPAWVCMTVWNHYLSSSTIVGTMNIYHGLLLWAIIALTLYALNGKNQLIGFGNYPNLSREQIRDIVNRAKVEESQILKDLEKRIQDIKNESPQVIMPKDLEPSNLETQTEDQKEEIRG